MYKTDNAHLFMVLLQSTRIYSYTRNHQPALLNDDEVDFCIEVFDRLSRSNDNHADNYVILHNGSRFTFDKFLPFLSAHDDMLYLNYAALSRQLKINSLFA